MLERWLITSNWTQEQWLIFSIIAFVVVAVLTGLSATAFWPLHRHAGATVSGHQIRPAGPGGRTPLSGPPSA